MSDTEIQTGSKDFTKGCPFRVTEADVQTRWAGQKPGSGTSFLCAWCGHRFQAGDVARWVYTNHKDRLIGGNPFICSNCDGDDCVSRLLVKAQEVERVKAENPWFFRGDK